MKKLLLATSALATSLVFVHQAWAQDQGLEEITVTAEKRSEDLQKTAIAVTAETGETLTDQGIHDVRGLAELVPGIILGQDYVFTQVDIRGVGANNDAYSLDPAIAYNIDGVYQARDLGTYGSFYDIDHVEVLRGPQGTLYGRNATGGAINVITNKPVDHFETGAEIDVGNYAEFRAFGMINVPVTDDFFIRAAFQSDKHDGYLTDGFNDQDSTAARIQALYQPSSDFSALVGIEYFRNDDIGQDTIVGRPYTDPSNPWFDAQPLTGLLFNGKPVTYNQFFFDYAIHGQIDWTVGPVTVTEIPAFKSVITNGTDPVVGVANTGSEKDRSFSNELRISSSEPGPLKWVGGLYFFNETDYVNSDYFGGTATGCGFFQYCFSANTVNPNIGETSGAVFGEATYNILDTLRLTGGLRYSIDSKTSNGQASTMQILIPFFPLSPAGPPIPDNFNQTYHHLDYKVRLDADLSPQNLVYASITTGYLEGGFNLGSQAGFLPNYQPEKITSYAVGSKNRFLDNHLLLNAEAFYYDYDDYIVSEYLTAGPAVGNFALFNAKKTEIYGGEIEGEALIDQGDKINANMALLHAQYTDFNLPASSTATNLALSGYQAMKSPYLTAAAGYTKIWDLGDSGTIDFNAQTNFSMGYWTLFDHSPGSRQPAYTQTNLTLTYTTESGDYHVQLYADNVENSAIMATEAPANSSSPPNTPWTHAEPPQTFGVRLGVHFDVPKSPSPANTLPPPPPAAPVAPPVAAVPEAQREFQVFFDFDKSDITDAAAKVIQAAADVVKSGGVAHITVTGHTDTVGTAKYNQALSERRAASVKTQLVSDGVGGGEISTVGVGKNGLLVPTADGVREPQNRRAVIQLQ